MGNAEPIIGLGVSSGIYEAPMDYGGREHIVWLNELKSNLGELGGALRGGQAWKKQGVSVNRMSELAATLMTGEIFDINVAVLLPKDCRNWKLFMLSVPHPYLIKLFDN